MTVDDVFFFDVFFFFNILLLILTFVFFNSLSLFPSALTRFLYGDGSTPFSRSISKLPCPPRTHLPVPALTFKASPAK